MTTQGTGATTAQPRTVLVAGAGAIGQFLGARLQDAGHNVQLLTTARHVKPLKALQVTGLSQWTGALEATADLATLRAPLDAIVLACKAHQTQHLTPRVAPLLAADGVFLSLQNGLGNAQKIARFVPAARIAVALTSHGIMLEKPGLVRHAGIGGTQVGPHVQEGGKAATAAHALLCDAGLEPESQEAMRGFVWRKAMINHAVNPIAALNGVPNGEVLARPDLHALATTLLKEAQTVAAKAGVTLPPGDLQGLLDATLQRTATNRVSMLQDVEAKRPTEIEQLTGRLVRLGDRLHAFLPASKSVYGRVKAFEAAYLGAEAAARLTADELPWEAEPF